MKLMTIPAILLAAVFAAQAHAEPAKTREQVKAELAEAIRTGDILSGSDTLAKLNELYPDRYRSEIRMAEKNGSNAQ